MSNGVWADSGQYLWPVAIKGITLPHLRTVFCSGTVIAPYWVLTSASCVTQANIFEVRHRSLLHFTDGTVETSLNSYIHPYYNVTSNSNNVALLSFPRAPFTSSQVLKFLPRADHNKNLAGRHSIVTGWGKDVCAERISPVLQYVNGVVVANTSSECQSNWNGRTLERNDILCANFANQVGCAGDTGSPLVVRVERVWYLIGVAAYDATAAACQRSTTLFTPLFAFRDWVAAVTQIANI